MELTNLPKILMYIKAATLTILFWLRKNGIQCRLWISILPSPIFHLSHNISLLKKVMLLMYLYMELKQYVYFTLIGSVQMHLEWYCNPVKIARSVADHISVPHWVLFKLRVQSALSIRSTRYCRPNQTILNWWRWWTCRLKRWPTWWPTWRWTRWPNLHFRLGERVGYLVNGPKLFRLEAYHPTCASSMLCKLISFAVLTESVFQLTRKLI